MSPWRNNERNDKNNKKLVMTNENDRKIYNRKEINDLITSYYRNLYDDEEMEENVETKKKIK